LFFFLQYKDQSLKEQILSKLLVLIFKNQKNPKNQKKQKTNKLQTIPSQNQKITQTLKANSQKKI